MADAVRIPASEQLRTVAVAEREGKLIPINEYKPTSFEYGASNPNALSDGDEKGKGELTTIGSRTDIITRNSLFGVNQYTEAAQYTSPE
jgi:hypothetical protein